METRILTETEYSLWDKLVEDSSQGTLFHTSRWLNNNGNLAIYGCFRNDELVGGCPLFIRDGILFRSASSTFDMCPYAGIVIKDSLSDDVRKQEKYRKDIIGSLCDIFNKERFSKIEIAFSPNSLFDIRPLMQDGWKYKLRYAYYFDFDEMVVSKKVRNILKKAQKNDLDIIEAYDVNIFYGLYIDTYRKQGQSPPMSKKFFMDTLNIIKKYNMGQMWMVEKEGIPLSAEIILWDNNDCFRWAAASNPEYNQLGGTTFLLFNVLKELKRLGFSSINLMGANTPHLVRFLSAFNPRLVSFHNVYKYSWFRDVFEYGYNKLLVK